MPVNPCFADVTTTVRSVALGLSRLLLPGPTRRAGGAALQTEPGRRARSRQVRSRAQAPRRRRPKGPRHDPVCGTAAVETLRCAIRSGCRLQGSRRARRGRSVTTSNPRAYVLVSSDPVTVAAVSSATRAWSGPLPVYHFLHQEDGKGQVSEQGSQPHDESGQQPGLDAIDRQTARDPCGDGQPTKVVTSATPPARPARS